MILAEDAASVRVAIPPCEDPRTLRPANSGDTLRFLEGETMGTTWSARFFTSPECAGHGYRAAIETELRDITEQMSHWLAYSDLAQFNRLSAGKWALLRSQFFEVLDFALQVAAETDGAFDPTLGPVVDEWGFGPGRKKVQPPDGETLSVARSQCGWRKVETDRTNRRARHLGGIGLDLSAVAKGFAVDRIARRLDSLGIVSYLVEIGGELRARGLKPDGRPWWVGVEPPGTISDRKEFPEIRVALSGWSVATSGDGRRSFEFGGRRWSHTIDPRTARPIDERVAAVSVLHKDCMAADAYATGLLVLGSERGLEFADQRDLAALFAIRLQVGFQVRCSARWRRMLD